MIECCQYLKSYDEDGLASAIIERQRLVTLPVSLLVSRDS